MPQRKKREEEIMSEGFSVVSASTGLAVPDG